MDITVDFCLWRLNGRVVINGGCRISDPAYSRLFQLRSEVGRAINSVCSDPFRVRYVCSESRKIGLMTAKTQFSAHRFCCTPLMDRNDSPMKSIA